MGRTSNMSSLRRGIFRRAPRFFPVPSAAKAELQDSGGWVYAT